MEEKTIHLHIGTHKTASTTIQAGCHFNGERLAAAGWLYPQTGRYIYGQHNIAWQMAHGRPQPWNHHSARVAFRPAWGGMEALLEEINRFPGSEIILSSEDFDGLAEDRIGLLREHLRNFRVEVVVYFREQAALLQSAWAQFVKSGFLTNDFYSWLDEMLAAPDSVQRYFGRYDLFLIPWCRIFGKEHLHVQRLFKGAFSDSIFYDFLRVCGVPDEGSYENPADQNVSPGSTVLELNRLFSQTVVNPEHRQLICREVHRYVHDKGWQNIRFNPFSDALYSRVRDHFSAANKAVAGEYFGGGELFPPEPSARQVSCFDPASLSAQERLELEKHLLSVLAGASA